MARILAISSQVASGHVGLSAIVPALQALGHEVIALPTVLLANHPGRQPTSGTTIAVEVLAGIVTRLMSNGRLTGIDAVLSGYLPSAAHVIFAADTVRQCQGISPKLTYLCDPIIGDDPKGVYIDIDAAEAIKTTLVPLAEIVTPNRFELAWLSRQNVDGAETAIKAARLLARPLVVATSIPVDGTSLATLAISKSEVDQAAVPLRAEVPNGTGDLLTALFLAGYLKNGANVKTALSSSIATIDNILAASVGQPEMALIAALKTLAV